MLFLFRSAPEVEKRIHSKFFRKFWRSRGTKEPAYITVEHTVNECGRAARGSCLSSACVDILKSFFELYIFGRQVCFTEWVVYNICAFATICSRSTSVFSTGPGSGKQGQAKELQTFVHLILWQSFSYGAILWKPKLFLWKRFKVLMLQQNRRQLVFHIM